MNRVLVVDDDWGMRAALEARFLRRGWQVETAANAPDAIEKFRRGLHPLIVTDIRMPGQGWLVRHADSASLGSAHRSHSANRLRQRPGRSGRHEGRRLRLPGQAGLL
jgi:CheY-like chemotaxis protein